jgi:hypothetical protein
MPMIIYLAKTGCASASFICGAEIDEYTQYQAATSRWGREQKIGDADLAPASSSKLLQLIRSREELSRLVGFVTLLIAKT